MWRFSFSSVLRKDKKGAACFVLPAFRWLFLPVMSYTILLRKQPACGGGKGRESTRVGGAGVGERWIGFLLSGQNGCFLGVFFPAALPPLLPRPCLPPPSFKKPAIRETDKLLHTFFLRQLQQYHQCFYGLLSVCQSRCTCIVLALGYVR